MFSIFLFFFPSFDSLFNNVIIYITSFLPHVCYYKPASQAPVCFFLVNFYFALKTGAWYVGSYYTCPLSYV